MSSTSSRRIIISRNEWHTADVHVDDEMMKALKANDIDLYDSEAVAAYLLKERYVDNSDFDSEVEFGPVEEASFQGWEEFEPEEPEASR